MTLEEKAYAELRKAILAEVKHKHTLEIAEMLGLIKAAAKREKLAMAKRDAYQGQVREYKDLASKYRKELIEARTELRHYRAQERKEGLK